MTYLHVTTYFHVGDQDEFDFEESDVVSPEVAKNPSPIERNEMCKSKGHRESKANKAGLGLQFRVYERE